MKRTSLSRAVRLCALSSILVVAGCGSDYSKELKFAAMPEELADCRVYRVQNDGGYDITVVRCPNNCTGGK